MPSPSIGKYHSATLPFDLALTINPDGEVIDNVVISAR